MENTDENEHNDQYITNIPTENSSLLLKMLNIGTGDILPIIFKHVTSLKEKVRMERVCWSFRKYAKSFCAWSDIKYLRIMDKDTNHHWINIDRLATNFLADAIKSILIRIQSVILIDVQHCKCPVTFSTLSVGIREQGVHSLHSVRELRLLGNRSPEISAEILQLIDVFKSQLNTLTLGYIRFDDMSDMERFWTVVGGCVNLNEFGYYDDRNGRESISLPADMITRALRQKPIEWLGLSTISIQTTELIEILNSIYDQRLLRSLFISNIPYLFLDHFVETLYVKRLSGLREFHYRHFGWLQDSTWQIILRLPHLFPQLICQSLKLTEECDITPEMIVNLIISYLSILNSKKNWSMIYKLDLFVSSVDDADYEWIFESLAKDHKCRVVHAKGKTSMWNGDNMAGCLELCDVD